jgi:hypothetical protein
MKQLSLIFAGFLVTALIITGFSCQKDTDCKAKVICRDSSGVAVANANVLLYAVVKDPNDPTGQTTYTADVKANGTSDSGGEAAFVFKLPAIYDIRATLTVGTKTLVGTGIIKLEEGKSVEKTVTMK